MGKGRGYCNALLKLNKARVGGQWATTKAIMHIVRDHGESKDPNVVSLMQAHVGGLQHKHEEKVEQQFDYNMNAYNNSNANLDYVLSPDEIALSAAVTNTTDIQRTNTTDGLLSNTADT